MKARAWRGCVLHLRGVDRPHQDARLGFNSLLAYQEPLFVPQLWRVIRFDPENPEQFHGDTLLYRTSKTVFRVLIVGEPCLSWSCSSFVSVWSGRLLSSPLTKHLPAEEAAEFQIPNVNYRSGMHKDFLTTEFWLDYRVRETSIIQPSMACCYLQQQ